MSSEFNTYVEAHADFRQERITLPLDEIAKREVDAVTKAPSVVLELFEYWKERCTNALPSMADFQPGDVFTPEKFRWIAWVNLRQADPLSAILCKHPANVFGDWSGKTLRDYHNPYHARSCAFEYLTCKMVRRPFYHEIRQTIGKVSRTYTRLLLPVADAKRPVTRLYYAVRHVDMSVEGG